MELRRLGDPFLRARASPLLFFLAPSIPQSWASPRSLRRAGPIPPRSSFHTTTQSRAEKRSNNADLDFLSSPSPPTPTPQPNNPNPSFSQRISSNSTIASLLESTLDSLPNPTKPKASDRPPRSTLDLARRAYDHRSSLNHGTRIPGSIAGSMELPPLPASSNPSQEVANEMKRRSEPAKRAKRTIRSRPTVGRTIDVNPEQSGDFGRALRRLGMLCAVNKIRLDKSRQRFHERPGLKRKRLKSERWRRMFRDSFTATIARVQEMRRKGW